MSKLTYGSFEWVCPKCGDYFHKDTKQGLGMAKSNHLRIHRKKPEVNIELEKVKNK